MIAATRALLIGAAALTLTASAASAAVVCNGEGECWHIRGNPAYGPELRLSIHPDNWRWSRGERFRWREHSGHGYWRRNEWVQIR